MKPMVLLMAVALATGTAKAACDTAHRVTGFRAEAQGVTVTLADGELKLRPWTDGIVEVLRLGSGATAPASLTVVAVRAPVKFAVRESADGIELSTARLRLTVDRASGAVSFSDEAGRLYLREGAGSEFPAGSRLARLCQSFEISGSEAVYGLGQHQDGVMNLNRTSVHLQQANRDVGLPLLTSSRGYGLLWDNASVADVDVSPPRLDGRLIFASEAGHAVDYYFIAGPQPDQVIAGYRTLTGPAPLMARWTWGFWQSKEHYESQDELVGVIKRYRDMRVPVDAVIQDWQYWEPGQWGAHRFDPKRFPDPRKMLADLHAMHAHSIVSVWPRFDAGTDTLAELEAAGAVYPRLYPNVYPAGFGRWYDAFNPRGRELYWRRIYERLGRLGFDGYWLDASEAELGGDWGEMRGTMTAAGPGAEVYNAYPLMHSTGVYQGQKRDVPAKRAFILTRSAWGGQQRNAAVTWSGDINGDWETLRRQIPAGLNFVAGGIPYWNTDIGGFFGSRPDDPDFRELFVRWFEYGAFTPMFRVHGTGPGKEFWRFDEATQRILLAYDRLRYRLLPYIYSVSWAVTRHGYSMMRPLFMDFGADPLALNISDQYMFGPALLVNPVTQARAAARIVYLPAGGRWYDFWTGAAYDGGTAVTAAAPLETMPVFVRAGSILPLGPVVQYADENPQAPLELRVYRGADGAFTLYDDEGDGDGYERGRRATIAVTWNEARRELVFGVREGRYPGMRPARDFHVVWVGPGTGAGLLEGTASETVHYRGRRLVVAGPRDP